jgi:hypothetical protein
MSTTAKNPEITPIPVQLSEREFTAFIFPHLWMPKRGPRCKLGYHRLFNLNLSHYEPLNPDMDNGNGQKRVEADRTTLPTDDQATVFFLEPGESALGLEARHLHLERSAACLSGLPDPFRQLGTDAASAKLLT